MPWVQGETKWMMMKTELPSELIAMQGAMDQMLNAILNVCTMSPDRRIENDIMALRGFDYATAWELTAAIQAKLERVYEDKLDQQVLETFAAYRKAMDAQ